MSKAIGKRLGDIVTFKRGYDLTASERLSGTYPVISSGGITGYHSEYKRDGEGIVTGRYGTLGEVYYVNGKYWPHNTTLYSSDFHGNCPKYVYYLMKCLGNLKTSDKSTVPGINRNDLHELVIPFIEDKNSQIAIAKLLSSLDNKIEINQKVNGELEAMAKNLYDYWFVQFDFPNAKGQPYKTGGGKMVYNEILKREIPEEWKVKQLGDLANSINTGLNPRKHFKLGEGSNYYITIKNIEYGRLLFDSSCAFISDKSLQRVQRRSRLEKGDILFTSIEPVGKTYLLHEEPHNWNINESVFSFKPTRNVSSEFLFMLLSSDEIRMKCKNASTGSIHKGIRITPLKEFNVILPETTILENFTEITSRVLKKIDNNQKQNRQVTNLREWLLPLLMNGQVNVDAVCEKANEMHYSLS